MQFNECDKNWMRCIARTKTLVEELAQDFIKRGQDVRDSPDGGVVDQAVADLAV